MVRVLLNQRSLIKLIIDSDEEPRFLTKADREILWKALENDTLKLYITDFTLDCALAICRKIGGNEWAKNFITRIKKDNEVCAVTEEIIAKARLSKTTELDFEDILEVECIADYKLEGLVTHHPELFKHISSLHCLTPAHLLEHMPISVKISAAYSLKNQRDFSDWDLQEAEVGDVNLANSSFIGIDMAGADVDGANLSGCDFTRADLSDIWGIETDFSGSTLVETNFSGADLTSANFSNCDLTRANLARANLGKANLDNAKIAEVDFSVVDLAETDVSAINLQNTKLEDFTIRNISNSNELKQVFELQTRSQQTTASDFERLKERWLAYSAGIKALFYQQKIVTGIINLWALSDESALSLEESVKSGEFSDNELEVSSTRLLRRSQGSRYWYIDGIFLNPSFKMEDKVNRKYISLLISEAFQIWRSDEDKYIQKDSGKLEIFIWENDAKILKTFGEVLAKQKFYKLPGQTDSRKLYKMYLDIS
ncbi:MAG: pentapeptide repeat-containing protein [Brasilonema octagenarum HA4186-MV1]|jgi:uncharacterized protein YjbI with pentapeptide repeats|nr:pentapeptide repeat-containing protein [Brasilonema octagenarum HA4186-MV1]